ncbi:MAG: hypothetical protein R2682_01840 [Pyrinomonadaceae bacterium]
MTRQVLGDMAREEIRESIVAVLHLLGDRGRGFGRLATLYGVGRDRIYAITKDLRPKETASR